MLKTILLSSVLATAAFGVKLWVIEGFSIPTASMQPTLNIGDWVWIKKLPIYAPNRDELIAFKCPFEPNTHYIKRCIGLPSDSVVKVRGQYFLEKNNPNAFVIPKKGQKIAMNTGNFSFYQPLIQKYENKQAGLIGDKIYINNQPSESYTFSQNYYYVLGDNRADSFDSEEWGLLPESNLIGKAFFVWKK